MKKAIILAAVFSTAAVLGACRERHVPMKVGAMPAPVVVDVAK